MVCAVTVHVVSVPREAVCCEVSFDVVIVDEPLSGAAAWQMAGSENRALDQRLKSDKIPDHAAQ